MIQIIRLLVRNKKKLDQRGNGGMIFIFMIIAVIVILVMLPANYSEVPVIGGGCPIGEKPKQYEELTGLPAVPEVDLEGQGVGSLEYNKRNSTFVLIRKNVPMPKGSEVVGQDFFDKPENITTSPQIALGPGALKTHTANIGEFPQKPGYVANYPGWSANPNIFNKLTVYFATNKFIFFVKKDPKSIFPTPQGPIYTVDVYIQKESFDPHFDYEKDLFECSPSQLAAMKNPGTTQKGIINPDPVLSTLNGGQIATASQGLYIPDQKNSQDQEQLQLQYFLIQGQPLATWSTHCKPAIYLYPPKRELVNVKVFPAEGGSLKYTDPLYPNGGWNVEANPDGRIINLGANNFMKQYNYLYFESRVPDKVIQKPRAGWVLKQSELEAKFNDILPKLGLNEAQTHDFIEYWQKALPASPYYFVGIINQQNVDQIERLEITPKPDSMNRVRIYFEQLDKPKTVETPDLKEFGSWDLDLGSSAFKVVEWGGMVKNDLNHPFTCSQ